MAADETEAEKRRQALARIEGRSPLHDWMRSNRGELEAQFAAIRRPSWASVAKVLAELGVKDAKGQPPNPQTARQAWVKVRASAPFPVPVAGSPQPPSAPPVPTRPPSDAPAGAPPALAVVPAAPAHRSFDPMEGAFDPKPAPRFKPASLK